MFIQLKDIRGITVLLNSNAISHIESRSAEDFIFTTAAESDSPIRCHPGTRGRIFQALKDSTPAQTVCVLDN